MSLDEESTAVAALNAGDRAETVGEGIGVGRLGENAEGIRIIADERNNALVILATVAEYRLVEATLDRLDILPLQVLIEATIAEVSLDDTLGLRSAVVFRIG